MIHKEIVSLKKKKIKWQSKNKIPDDNNVRDGRMGGESQEK